jgi:hypothetical protein
MRENKLPGCRCAHPGYISNEAGIRQAPAVRSRTAFYTLKRFDLFSPMCIIPIDGTAKSEEKADHGLSARAGQAIHQGCGHADGTGR